MFNIFGLLLFLPAEIIIFLCSLYKKDVEDWTIKNRKILLTINFLIWGILIYGTL